MRKKESERPVGVFDSGVGGLSVLRALKERLPGENFIYFGDTARTPYGVLSSDEVRRFTVEIGAWLLERDCKMIVIACNTATVMGMTALRSMTAVPIVGMVEAALRGVFRTGDDIWPVGLIATEGTLANGAYQAAFAEKAPGKPLYTRACPDFTTLVERGKTEGPEVDQTVMRYLTPLRDKGIRTLVFGCTHYPFLASAIAPFLGEGVGLVDPAVELASMAEEYLEKNSLLNGVGESAGGSVEYWCSGDRSGFISVAGVLLGRPVDIVKRQVF